MRLQIDISDAAVEEHEEIHQLHLWGFQTSLWKTSYRPSSNHRRIGVIQSEPPWLKLVWAEVKDSHLIIDHPTFDDFYGGSQAGSVWLDLAVINPAVESEPFRKIGHGLAMGFSSTMMDPEAVVEAKLRNGGPISALRPGYQGQWPGPLIFFCYGYPLSDYVKVDPTQSDDVERGAEGKMSSLEIWTELNTMRYKSLLSEQECVETQLQRKGKEAASKSVIPNAGPVWKWKVKEHGTSMRILDLTHKDLVVVFDYLALSQLNPSLRLLRPWNSRNIHAIHVQDLNHPGYGIKDLCNYVHHPDTYQDNVMTAYFPKVDDRISLREIVVPLYLPTHPVVGAFAVGLPWMAYYSMDINPPFRQEIPVAPRWPLMELMWTIGIDTVGAPHLALHVPTSACDSVVLMHVDAALIHPHHARALYKYLRHTDPREWTRRGPKGFESYWAVYAKVEMVAWDKVPDVYAAEPRSRRMVSVQGNDEIGMVMAHLTLEGLEKESPQRREEIAMVKREMFDVICEYREAPPGRHFGTD